MTAQTRPRLNPADPESGRQLVQHVASVVERAGLTLERSARNEGLVPDTNPVGHGVQPAGIHSLSGPGRTRGLTFTVVIDGQACGLRYRTTTEDGRRLHRPDLERGRETLLPRVRAALEADGLPVTHLAFGGFQMHWDHGVDLLIETGL